MQKLEDMSVEELREMVVELSEPKPFKSIVICECGNAYIGKDFYERYKSFNPFKDSMPCCGGSMDHATQISYIAELLEKEL